MISEMHVKQLLMAQRCTEEDKLNGCFCVNSTVQYGSDIDMHAYVKIEREISKDSF